MKVILPYIEETINKINNIVRKKCITTIFTTEKRIRQIISNPKDKINLENQVICEIPCRDCPRSHIDKTNRKIAARRDEHKRAIKNERVQST